MRPRHLPALLVLAAFAAAPRVGAESLRSVSCSVAGSDCTIGIPDGVPGLPGTVETSLTLSDYAACIGAPVLGVGVSVYTAHGHIGDLAFALRAPGGSFVSVLERQAAEGGAPGSCAGDDTHVAFVDSAAAAASCDSGIIPGLRGQVLPLNGPLGAAVPTGSWTLRVSDEAPGGVGRLRDWALVLRCDLPDALLTDGFEAL